MQGRGGREKEEYTLNADPEIFSSRIPDAGSYIKRGEYNKTNLFFHFQFIIKVNFNSNINCSFFL
jgi:hypothetical protein